MSDSPEGWSSVRVRDYFECWGGMTPSTAEAEYWGGDTPWISSKDVKQGRVRTGTEHITKRALAETRLRKCRPGTVLVVVRSGVLAHTLPVAITDAEVVVNQDVKALDSGHDVLNEWLALYLRAFAPGILEENRKDGTTVQSVRVEQLLDRSLPLPPLAEQQRIVASVDSLLAQVSAARKRLVTAQRIVARFRQAVLAAACAGRLTRQGVDSNNLPPGWGWRRLADIAERVSVGHVGPTTAFYASADTGVPFVRSQNVRPGLLQLRGVQHITRAFHKQLRKSQLRPGDLLFVRVGANRGDVCVVPDGTGELNCANVVFARPHAGLSKWISLFCQSPDGQGQLEAMTTGSAQGVLNTSSIAELQVPVPPAAERELILRRVAQAFALTDAVDRRLTAALARADRLPRAVLTRAFAGRLVPTEAELARADGRAYEPANVLLRRIAVQRTPVAPKRRGRAASGAAAT